MQYNTTMDNALKAKKIEMFVNGVKCALTDYDPMDDVYVGQTFNVGDVLTIKPLNGYLLGTCSFTNTSPTATYKFTISADKKLGSLTVVKAMIDYATFLKYNFATTVAPVVPNPTDPAPIDVIKKGVNNLYLLDATTAREVMSKRFTLMTANGSFTDKAEAIIGLINIPFVIDSKYKLPLTNVKLANFDTGLQGIELNTDTLIIDMGFINVPHMNNDLTDYESVEVVLNLPYTNSIKLDKADVIGYKISIEYWINAYNGSCVINIYSSKNNGMIDNKKIDLGVTVPFNKMEGSTPTNNKFNDVDSSGYNGINTPYIEVKTYDTILKQGLFTNPIIDEKVLTGEKGFIEVENIELTVNAMLQEKSEILNLLSQGVIIK